jgi:hypothetical protein
MQFVPHSPSLPVVTTAWGLLQQYSSLPVEPSSPSRRSLQLGSGECLSACTSSETVCVCWVHTVSICSHFAVTGSGWNICMDGKRCSRGGHECLYRWWEVQHKYYIMTKDVGSKEGIGGCGGDCEAESEPHGTATLLRHCSEIIIRDISAAQIHTVQNSSRISTAGYPNFSCPYQSPAITADNKAQFNHQHPPTEHKIKWVC